MPFMPEIVTFYVSCKNLPCKTLTSLKADIIPLGQAEPWHFNPLAEVRVDNMLY